MTSRRFSGSDESDNGSTRTPERSMERETSQTQSVLSHRFRESPQKAQENRGRKSGSPNSQIAVEIKGRSKPWDHKPSRGDTTVDSVQAEVKNPKGESEYKIQFEDGKRATVSLDKLLRIRNGQNALDFFASNQQEADSADSAEDSANAVMSEAAGKRLRKKTQNEGFVSITEASIDSDEEDGVQSGPSAKKRRLQNGRVAKLTEGNNSRQSSRSTRGSRHVSRAIEEDEVADATEFEEEEEKEASMPRRAASSTRNTLGKSRSSTRNTRSGGSKLAPKSRFTTEDEDEDLSQNVEEESEGSEIVFEARKSTRVKPKPPPRQIPQPTKRETRRRVVEDRSSSSELEQPTRRSGRERIRKSMKEHDMDEEVYADEVPSTVAPKIISIREIYQAVDPRSQFVTLHSGKCDVCKSPGKDLSKGDLIYCQGCSISIHKGCLGYRAGREHMVTKIGHESFVMQCRRCIGIAIKKDEYAPRLDVCHQCGKPGASCAAFSTKKTAKIEEKLREENGGNDPITEVSASLINNPSNLLFRCTRCHRGTHFAHLPPLKKSSKKPDDDVALRDVRRKEYGGSFECNDCLEHPQKPSGLVAWRPVNRESYTPDLGYHDFGEDDKEYLVRWTDQSYFDCVWMPGSWVWGVTTVMMRKAFLARDESINEKPKWTSEEAIPEEYLRIEIVFDVEYIGKWYSESEKSDKARVDMVDRVLCKFEGLGYEETVWADSPSHEDEERYSCFVVAYNEYVRGLYFKDYSKKDMTKKLDAFHALDFRKKVEVKKQPAALVGGDLMAYQKEGMNWMLYNFHKKKNVILADEMGLGKTIQVIALLSTLITDKPKCFPFLIVTPNSTCPNWCREIRKWCPSIRVVAFYGGAKARDMAMDYELYPNGPNGPMSAHVVVTSYETPITEAAKPFFKKVNWAGMIVDEGQRLKNDENLLYLALKALKTPWQCLLTGTPLQNNKRELFNLLSFLDPSLNATKLDDKYLELTKDNLPELQDLIRPFFLRRTKQLVLKDLPSLSQVILPVSMSIVQKKLYKSILAKNPQLIKSIFGARTTDLRASERGNLNNILMQLRKCLCHPFTYSSAIEETSVGEEAMHRNLIDASSKFQLLEIMLPKLKERGHRVLLFSQFLNMLDLIEDFLKGLGLTFRRLDGNMGAQEKQKRIDEFNAPDSDVFAFMLSTRSGGVGINLATADTVIIMDPDFNPQQDIQAISRAHRIGQKNKVLVFQLMNKNTAEEKIIQIGRKKIALGALIETATEEEDAGVDLESILKHGTKALFDDDDTEDIHYDSASVDKLLDRAQIENTHTDEEKTAVSQFSLARVWAQDKGSLEEGIGDADEEEEAPNISVWEKLLKEREEEAAREAAKNMQDFGRGKRARHTVNYEKNMDVDDDAPARSKANRRSGSVSDQDFRGAAVESDVEDDSETHSLDPNELEVAKSTASQPQVTRIVPPTQQPPSSKPSGKLPKGSKSGLQVQPRADSNTISQSTVKKPAGIPANGKQPQWPPQPRYGAPANSYQQQAPGHTPNPLTHQPPPSHFRVQGTMYNQQPILPPNQHHGANRQPQRHSQNFVTVPAPPRRQNRDQSRSSTPPFERTRNAVERVLPLPVGRDEFDTLWLSGPFQNILSNDSNEYALEALIERHHPQHKEIHRNIFRAYREAQHHRLIVNANNASASVSVPGVVGSNSDSCKICKLEHSSYEDCPTLKKESEIRILLDELERKGPTLMLESEKLEIAKKFLKQRLRNLHAAKKSATNGGA